MIWAFIRFLFFLVASMILTVIVFSVCHSFIIWGEPTHFTDWEPATRLLVLVLSIIIAVYGSFIYEVSKDEGWQ